MLETSSLQAVENVLIFVCDALRWDRTPGEILKLGPATKTVASSLYTGAAFPSMISGLYPPRHGVNTWQDTLPENRRGLLALSGFTTSLWCETSWVTSPPDESGVHDVLGNPPGVCLEDIEPPFIYVEDDKGGHCPYGLPFSTFDACSTFFSEYGRKGRQALIRQYDIGIQQSIDRLHARLDTLERRGLRSKTLVIFTSDHGELLGEYGGLTAHGRPCCPELVYVPTVFVHPSLAPESPPADGLMRHVDLFPTIADLLGQEIGYDTDGVSLLDVIELPKVGLCFRKGSYFKTGPRAQQGLDRWMRKLYGYEAQSVWDSSGGHVFHRSIHRSLPYFIYKLLSRKNPESHFMQQDLREVGLARKASRYGRALRCFVAPHRAYLEPGIDKSSARSMLDEYLEGRLVTSPQPPADLDEEMEERFRALGYID